MFTDLFDALCNVVDEIPSFLKVVQSSIIIDRIHCRSKISQFFRSGQKANHIKSKEFYHEQHFREVYIIYLILWRLLVAPFSHNIASAWAEIYVITIAFTICNVSQPARKTSEWGDYFILKKSFKLLFGRHVKNSNSSESTYLLTALVPQIYMTESHFSCT